MKRISSFVLGMTFIGSLCFAAGSTETAATDITVLDLMVADTGRGEVWDYENNVFLQEMRDRTNVQFNIIPVPNSDYAEKTRITLVSGDLPDIMVIRRPENYRNEMADGMFLDFSNHLDVMPNFVKAIGEDPIIKRNQIDDNGAIYWLAQIRTTTSQTHRSMGYRMDIYEKHGLEPGGTFEEFYDTLRALKRLYPESEPYQNSGGFRNLIYRNFNQLFQTGGPDRIYWDYWGGDEFTFGPLTENYRTMIESLNKLYAEGLLNKTFLSLSGADYQSAIVQGKGFVGFNSSWTNTSNITRAGRDENKNPDFVFAAGPFPSYDGSPPKMKHWGFLNTYASVVADAQTQFPEVVAKYLDYTYTEEASQISVFGKEGVTFEYDQRGNPRYIKSAVDPEASDFINQIYSKGLLLGHNTMKYFPGFQEIGNPAYVNAELDYYRGEYLPDAPFVTFNDDELNELKTRVALYTYAVEMTLKFIIGEEDFSNWDAFVSQTEELGAQVVLKIYNRALGRWNSR
jgi:putative aldouronate transport system substrate-binding protein